MAVSLHRSFFLPACLNFKPLTPKPYTLQVRTYEFPPDVEVWRICEATNKDELGAFQFTVQVSSLQGAGPCERGGGGKGKEGGRSAVQAAAASGVGSVG